MSSTVSTPMTFESHQTKVSPREISTVTLVAGALVLASGVAMALSAMANLQRFAFTYLVGFLFLVTIGLGALFFVLLQHVTGASWSLGPRRTMEWLSGTLLAALVLFIPLVPLGHDVWFHWMGHHAAEDPLLQEKAVWLNAPFFYVRSFFYLGLWAAISTYFYARSRAYDETGDPKEMSRLARLSAPAIIAFGLTITFAAFDWVMSLDPHWYSTIFGVYIFSGSVVSALAVLSLLFIALEKGGYYARIFHVEHQHDVGKLLFGFTMFWAYIAFSQYLLIWYANIPEETEFYRHRFEGSWKWVSAALLAFHFVVPFLMLLSRHTKRNRTTLTIASVIIIVMHGVDLFWLVMPTLDEHGAHLNLTDVGGLLFPLSVGVFAVLARVRKSATFPRARSSPRRGRTTGEFMSHEMSHDHTAHDAHGAHGAPHESDVAVEADNPKSGLIALVTGGFAIGTLAMLAAFNTIVTATSEGEVFRKTLEPESSQLRTLRANESEKLSRYQWVDRQTGAVRLPIERASELVLDRYTDQAAESETGARK